MKTLGMLPRAVRPGRCRFALISLLLTLFLASCGGGSSSTPSTATTTTITGSVMLSNDAASGLLASTTGVLATTTFCAAELKGADVYLYDADRLEWLYPVARATTGPDCSYTLHQLINSSFNRNADGSRAYNDNNPIPAGNYTVIASNNIMITGGNQLVAVQSHISNFKGDVTGNDLVAYSNDTVPAVTSMLGLAQNPDGTFCGTGAGTGSNEAIQIAFNMAMARVSVINNIKIMGGGGIPVAGKWKISADLLFATFYPDPGLKQEMSYTIYVDAVMQNVYGKRLAQSVSCSFVAGAANANAPEAAWYSPSVTTGVPVNTPIQIVSSKYLDLSTINVTSTPGIGDKPSMFFVGNTSTVPGKPYIYEIVPAGLLAYNTSYSMSVSGALDLAGNPLATLSTSFTTKAAPTPPAVISTSPAASATGVALNADVRAVFSSQMAPSTINAMTFTLGDGTANVAGSVAYEAATKTAVFTPSATLRENTLYTALINIGATDLNGLAMASGKTWSFTTLQTLNDTTAPTVPSGLQAAAASMSQMNISWWAASDNVAVTGYKIYNDTGGLVASTAATSYSHSGLVAGTQYCYRVSALDAAGNESGKSALACAATSQPLPQTGAWTATATTGAPGGRTRHNAAWTGSKMIVWGGWNGAGYTNTGGIYYPATDTWTATTTTGAPSGLDFNTAVWTGSKMIVWGGDTWCFSPGYNKYLMCGYTNTGGIYDPVTDTWTATATTGAPSARYHHTAVWTGSRMLLWGGHDGTFTNTGGIYDPATDSWSVMSAAGVPTGRYDHTAVWTGTRMMVWGGYDGSISPYPITGGLYDPATDTWSVMSITGAPAGRSGHTAIWTGTRMIVWGGYDNSSYLNTGGLYDPATDTWSAINTIGAPTGRSGHSAVWTGSRMIVWGGTSGGDNHTNSGGIYDPATNTWAVTNITGAPTGRYNHTAVWTGSNMIIWSGYDMLLHNTGGIYTP